MADLSLRIIASFQDDASRGILGMLNPLRGFEGIFAKLGASAGVFNNGIGNLIFGFRNLGTAGTVGMDAIKLGAVGVGRGLLGMGVNVARLGIQLLAVGAVITGIGAIAGIALGIVAVKAAADFQQQMLKVFALTGMSKTEFDNMNASLLAMAPAVGVGPVELAKALYYVESDGFKGAAALNLVKLSAEGAQVGLTDTMTVAFALTSAIRAFSFADKDATKVMDIMNNTVKQGKMEWGAYAVQVGRLSTAAKTAGVGFTEANSALSTLTQSGSSAAKGTTFLINLFNQMALKTDAMAKHAKAAGIAFDEQKFQAMSLGDKIAYLTQVTHGNAAAMMKLMGNNSIAVRGYELLRDHAGAYANILKNLNHSTDAANNLQTAWNITQQGLNLRMEQAKQAVNTLAITIGNQLLPYVTQLLNWVMPLIVQFTAWAAKSHVITDAMGGLGNILHQIGSAFQAVFHPIQQVQQALKPLTDTFDRASSIIKSTTVATKPLLDTFDRGKGIISATTVVTKPLLDTFDRATGVFHKTAPAAHGVVQAVNPFIPIFQAIANVIRFFITVYSVVSTIIQASISVFKAIANVVQQVGSFFRTYILPILIQIGSFLKANFLPVWQQLVSVWQSSLLPSLKQLWSALIPLMPLLKLIGGVILGVVVLALIILVALLAAVIKGIAGFLSGLIVVVSGIIQVFTGVTQIIGGIVGFITDLITGKFNKLGADLGMIWQGILNVIIGLWTTIAGVFQTAWFTISGIVTGFVQGIVGAFTGLYNALVGHSIVPNTINAIVMVFATLAGRVTGPINNAVHTILSILGNAIGAAANAGANIVKGIANGITAGIHWVAGAIGNVVSFISSHLPHSPAKVGPLRDLEYSGGQIVAQLSKGMEKAKPTLQTSLNMMVSPIGTGMSAAPGTGGGRSANGAGSGGGVTIVIEHIHVNDFGPNMPQTVANQISDKVSTTLASRFRLRYNGAVTGVGG